MDKEQAISAAKLEGDWADASEPEALVAKEEASLEVSNNARVDQSQLVEDPLDLLANNSASTIESVAVSYTKLSTSLEADPSVVSAVQSDTGYLTQLSVSNSSTNSAEPVVPSVAPSAARPRKTRKESRAPKSSILEDVGKEVASPAPAASSTTSSSGSPVVSAPVPAASSSGSEQKFSVDVQYYPTHNAALQLKPEHDDRIIMSLFWEDFQRSLHTQCEIEVKNSLYIQKMEEYINRSLANSQASGEGMDKSVRPLRSLTGPKADKKSREPVTFIVRSTSKDIMSEEVKKLATLVISVYYKKNYAAAYFLVGKKNADYKKIRSECARVGNKLQCKIAPLRGYSHKKEVVYLCCTGTTPQSAQSNLNKAAEMMGMKPDEAEILAPTQVVKASKSESSSNGDYTMTFTI